jgi:hypothetical protein
MKASYKFKKIYLAFLMSMLIFSISDCTGSSNSGTPSQIQGYPIESTVVTTAVKKIVSGSTFSQMIPPQDLCQISKFNWEKHSLLCELKK